MRFVSQIKFVYALKDSSLYIISLIIVYKILKSLCIKYFLKYKVDNNGLL